MSMQGLGSGFAEKPFSGNVLRAHFRSSAATSLVSETQQNKSHQGMDDLLGQNRLKTLTLATLSVSLLVYVPPSFPVPDGDCSSNGPPWVHSERTYDQVSCLLVASPAAYLV